MEGLQLAIHSGKLAFTSKWRSLSARSSDHESEQQIPLLVIQTE